MKPSDEIETSVHSAIVDAYSRRVAQENFDHLLQDGVLRSKFLAETLVDLFGSYGSEWTGSNAIHKQPSVASRLTTQLRDQLKSLSHRSQFLSFHLFDPLDNKRRSISSVLSSDFLAKEAKSASALKVRYEAIERLYIRLSENPDRQVPTLVNWLRQSVGDGPAKHFRFYVNQGRIHNDWQFIEFPHEQCEQLFANDSILTRWCRTIDIQSLELNAVVRSLVRPSARRHFPVFLKSFAKATGFSPHAKDSAEIALSFFLWQRSEPRSPDAFTIMPYYFRGIAWNLPRFNRTPLESESEHAFLAISCSARSHGLHDQDLELLDSLARGIASALAICGMEMARDSLRIVFLPYMLEHEVGNRLGEASSRLNRVVQEETNIPSQTQKELSDVAGELKYVEALAWEIANFPDPTKPLPHVIVKEQVAHFWEQLFTQMLGAQHPPMDRVSLVVSSARSRIPLVGQTESTLATVPWPAPVLISITHLRQILSNLINNSLEHAKAQAIEIRIGTSRTPQGYLALAIWDDGTEFRENASMQRFHFGHAIISRILESAQTVYPHTRFERPTVGAIGTKKLFRLILPTWKQTGREREVTNGKT